MLSRFQFVALLLMMASPGLVQGEFEAFNDQTPGPGTALNATAYNIFGSPNETSGALKDIQSGASLPVIVTLATNGPVIATRGEGVPNPNTPLYNAFNGYIDFPGGIISSTLAQLSSNATVTLTFSGLNPQRVYGFRASAVRAGVGDAFLRQWSLFQIDGALAFTSFHSAGCYTNGLGLNQVAINTGVNTNGDLAEWQGIIPANNGTFSITCSQYTGIIPEGGVADGGCGYALSCFQLSEKSTIVSANSRGDLLTVVLPSPVQAFGATNPANYTITNQYGSVVVSDVVFGTNNQTVVLNTKGQLPFMTHWLSISNLVDSGTGVALAEPLQCSFTNIAFTRGYIKSEIYTGLPGTNLSTLTNSPFFPDRPTRTYYYNISYWQDSAIGQNYGNRMSGILVPQVSGEYRFGVLAPGGCAVFLSPTEDPALKQLVGAGLDLNNISSVEPVTLTAGHHYYIETISKEGSPASDYAYLAWAMPDSAYWSLITGDLFGGYLTAPGTTISILRQPANATVYEARSATLTVQASSTSKIVPEPNYQWQLNGVDIPGATSSTYTTPLLWQTNSGSVYRVLIIVPGAAKFSSEAVVTVVRDLVPPTVARAMNFGDTKLQLIFSEPVDEASATNVGNYMSAGGFTVTDASLDTAGTTVTLTTSHMALGSNYTLVVNSVFDRAFVPNPIATNTVVEVFVRPPLPLDINGGTIPTVTTLVSNGVDIVSAGSGIGGTSDQFNFNYQLCSGDFDLKVRVAGLSLADLYAKAGLMARETLTPGSLYAATFATPSINGVFFEHRDSLNSRAASQGSFPVNYPDTWLRLQRSGNTLFGYAGYDGLNWTSLGNAYTSSNLLYVGFATCSRNTLQSAAVQYRDYGFVDSDGETVAAIENPHEALGPCSRKTPIVISEIMYKPARRTDGRNLEFLELYNSNPWFHDIGGYQLVADQFSYTIPEGTIIPGGGFLAIAAVPRDIVDVYGMTNVLGPYTGSLKKSTTLQMFDEHGAVLLTVPYSNQNPWPVAADATGHSLILANPTYGEEDPRAWDISDSAGGSPGAMDAFHPSALREVVINEILAYRGRSNVTEYIELYNRATVTNDLSGCILTEDPAVSRYRIPAGTLIPPGGFVSFDPWQTGLKLLASGQTIYLISPTGGRVLDAVQFEAQAEGISMGRWPDGAREFYPLSISTPGTTNSPNLVRDIVINELMHAPISGNDDDQYIELYNKGTNTVSLAGWMFTSGVNFTFPTNTSMKAGDYLVIARNITNLFAKYANLNSGNTLGNFSGKLSHGSERVALAMPQAMVAGSKTNTVYVVVDEVTFGSGGHWGQWSAGGGSSLELIDPRANHRLAANWGDSDERAKSSWVTIENTGVLDNGGSGPAGSGYAQFGPLDVGECLLDTVEVRSGTAGVNLVQNPGFENGATGWSMQGCMTRSTVENGGFSSGHSLHVRCSGRVWTGANSCQVALNSPLLSPGQTGTLRFKARWLHGCPEVLLRLTGNWIEAVGALPIPANLGTPGAPNSRRVSNAGPAVYDVTHAPAAPEAWEPAIVTARVHDPDGLKSLSLSYRNDPNTNYTVVEMKDNGTGGDLLAGDGIYSATIPTQGYASMVAYCITAKDRLGASTRFPELIDDNAPVRECLVMFGDSNPTTSFGVYHLWVSQTNLNRWSGLPNLSNELNDGTFVNGKRVIYNIQSRYAGSPYHQSYYRPDYDQCHFKWVFPEDDKFLGATSFNKIHSPGNSPGDDSSLQREQTAYTFMRALGVPWLNRRYVAVYVNGNRNVQLMEDTQCPDADMIKEYFPDDTDGYLYKMQPWFEFSPFPSGSYFNFNNVAWLSLMPFSTTTPEGKVKKVARYRYNFEMRRSPDSLSNYTNVFSLIDAASGFSSPNYVANMENLADMENWMRVFAANHAAGNWDSYGAQNAQNLYGYYSPKSTKYSLMMFDFNIVLGGAGSWGPGQNLFTGNSADSNTGRLLANPTFRRMYWRAMQELISGPLNVAKSGALIDAKYNTFVANGLSVENPSSIKSWLTSARNSIGSQLSQVNPAAFTVDPDIQIANGMAYITGLAPVGIKSILFNGVKWPIVWKNLGTWMVTVPLKTGTNYLSVVGVDVHGQPISGTSNSVQAIYEGTNTTPVGKVVINEIMSKPALANAEYVELFNASTDTAYDLSGWQLEGVGYVFPNGSLIGPNSYLVLAANRVAFAAAYGATTPLFDIFTQPMSVAGATLTLKQPIAGQTEGMVVSKVRWENVEPWPTEANNTGSSLQLIDSQQDNWRVGNWTSVYPPRSATPGAANTRRTNLPSFPSLWINELQAENLTGITNSSGQRTPWLELFNPGTNTVSLDGLFLANNYTNLTQWTFPAGIVVSPGEFKVIFADGQTNLTSPNELHADFVLPPGLGALALSLLDTNGQPVVLDYINYTNLAANHSFGSVPDGQSFVRREMLFVTPGSTNNGAGSSLSIAINEWMAGNSITLTNPVGLKCDDWFELYNYGTNAVDLTGCILTLSPADGVNCIIPAGYTIPPHGFLLVWADRKSAPGASDLHVDFKLDKDGTSIGLFGPDGDPIDYVSFGQQLDDVSMGRYPDGGGHIYRMAKATPRSGNLWVNSAPVLDPIADQTLFLGQTLSFIAVGRDADAPFQTLAFSLGSGAPAGAGIDAGSGLFVWTPTLAPSTNQVSVIVNDNGEPSRGAVATFTVKVLLPPGLTAANLNGDQFTLSWPTMAGLNYQLEYKDDLSASAWTPMGNAVGGTGAALTVTNQVELSHNRYFRLRIVP